MTPDEHFDSLTDIEKATAIAMQNLYWLNESSKQYLKDTDWYISRLTETGVPVPADILLKRQEARDAITGETI